MTSVLVAGTGGQGVITASGILGAAAACDGHDVKLSEIHGMSQRGGSVFSIVRFGERVHSPLPMRGTIDILVALEVIEAVRWSQWLSPDAAVLVQDLERVPPEVADETLLHIRERLNVMRERVRECVLLPPGVVRDGGHRSNTVFLGVLSTYLSISGDSWDRAFALAAPQGTLSRNLAAFHHGRQLVGAVRQET